MIADRPVDAAAAIGTNPDVLRVKDGARAVVTMTMITDPAAATNPDVLQVKDGARAAVTMTMITDHAVATNPDVFQVSATVMTTMTGRAAATSLVALWVSATAATTKIPGHGAGTTTATRIAAPPAAAGTMMTATRAEAAAGLATPKVIRKPLAEVGSAPTTGTAGGLATARVTRKPPAVAGSVLTMARAAGLATPKVIRTRLAGAGRTDIDPNAATTRMDAVEAAPARTRVSPAAAPATTIGVAKADAAGARRTTMIVDRRRPDGAMAAGRATPRAMPRLRAVGGKPAVKS
jgi:hypothetical protein